MKLINKTAQAIPYGLQTQNSGDCGTLEPNQEATWPTYDNEANVDINVIIPQTGTGMTIKLEQLG